MKTQLIPLSSETIQAFAERHDLTMVIRQRQYEDGSGKWYARFDKSDVKEGSFLCGRYGNGSTPENAIAEYATVISGCTLVINAFGNRQEISVPQLCSSPSP